MIFFNYQFPRILSYVDIRQFLLDDSVSLTIM